MSLVRVSGTNSSREKQQETQSISIPSHSSDSVRALTLARPVLKWTRRGMNFSTTWRYASRRRNWKRASSHPWRCRGWRLSRVARCLPRAVMCGMSSARARTDVWRLGIDCDLTRNWARTEAVTTVELPRPLSSEPDREVAGGHGGSCG